MKKGEKAPDLPLSTLRVSVEDMMALRVRTKEPGNPEPPEFLYQGVPAGAMALMATIPRGAFAVSIPHQGDLGIGFSIVKSPPSTSDGFVIIYARRPNGRYEAVEALFQGGKFGIAEFHETACRWVEQREGGLGAIPGRYAYFIPTRRAWGVILRDSGYAALDPSKVSPDITPGLQASRKALLSGDIVARIPVQAGDKQPPGAALPAFACVELTFDPYPRPQSLWVRFADFRKARILQSRPPASIVADFREWLSLLTEDSGFECWAFRPGMFFGDHIEWWGNQNRRRSEHEGLDFAEGVQPGAKIRSIPEGTPVRAMAHGEVVAVLDDFLDKTVVIRHPAITRGHGDDFYTLFSHIRPAAGLSGPVVKGQLLGKVGKSTSAGAPAHLHLTGAWIPQSIPPSEIGMDHLNPAFTPVVLVNFNGVVRGSLRKPRTNRPNPRETEK